MMNTDVAFMLKVCIFCVFKTVMLIVSASLQWERFYLGWNTSKHLCLENVGILWLGKFRNYEQNEYLCYLEVSYGEKSNCQVKMIQFVLIAGAGDIDGQSFLLGKGFVWVGTLYKNNSANILTDREDASEFLIYHKK